MLPIRGFDSASLITGPPSTLDAVSAVAVAVAELHHGIGNVRDSFLLPATLTIPEMSSLVLIPLHPPSFSFLPSSSTMSEYEGYLMCLICNTFTTV